MAFEIRLAEPADLEAAGRITVQAYRDDGYLADDHDYLEELADASARAHEAELWVAVDDTGVLGSVTFCPPGSRFAEVAGPGQGEFRMLGVAHRARRQGIGEALVGRCVERSRELGYAAVVMSSMAEMAAAHRVYERLGFRRMPERDWSPVAGVDLLAFIRPL